MIVTCFLWADPAYRYGARYGADHVNRLHRMLTRHLPGHELVCITDMPAGIDPAVRIVPLWERHRKIGGCYVKLMAFAPEMAGLIGPRFAVMDLDCVVTGPLAPLFDTPAEFKAWPCRHAGTHYNTSLFLLTAGSRAQVWERFDPPGSLRDVALSGAMGWDQAWVSLVLGPGEAMWGRDDGILNFRRDVLPHGDLPEGARVVFFPGDYDPSQPALLADHPWIGRHWC